MRGSAAAALSRQCDALSRWIEVCLGSKRSLPVKTAAIVSVALCCLACGANDEQLQPSPVPAPRATSGIVEGIVQAQVYRNAFDCRAFAPGQCTSPRPAAGAEVAVIDGPSAGMSTVADPNGKYRLEVSAGTIRLKFALAGYDDQFSSTYGVDQNGEVIVAPATLRMSAWAISGLVTDSSGASVAGAGVVIGDYVGVPIGNATTDGSGRYHYASAFGVPHPPQIIVSARKAGYETAFSSSVNCCNLGTDTVVNLSVRFALNP